MEICSKIFIAQGSLASVVLSNLFLGQLIELSGFFPPLLVLVLHNI